MYAIVSAKTLAKILAVGLATTACQTVQQTSRIKSVEIPQTEIKDQGWVGFCWAYSTTALLESHLLKKTGKKIDLSEEAIGYYRMAEELLALSKKYSAKELATFELVQEKSFEGLEGWDLFFFTEYHPDFTATGALGLIRKYGVVPESVWSRKIYDEADVKEFVKKVSLDFAALMQKHGQGNVTEKMIFDLLNQGPLFGRQPPTEFTLEFPHGTIRKVTSLELANEIIDFPQDSYTHMTVDKNTTYEQIITAMKIALARGLSVPLGFYMFLGQPNKKNEFTTKDSGFDASKYDSGHAVLVTDFVNQGSKPGPLGPDILKAEVAKPADALDYFVFKNSWGTSRTNPAVNKYGYYTIGSDNLKLLSKESVGFYVFVPRDIAEKARQKKVRH